MLKKEKKTSGFTIIETMVVVVIFAVVMSLALAVFLASIRSQREAIYNQRLVMETSHAMRIVEKNIRDGSIDLNSVDVDFFKEYLPSNIELSNDDFNKEIIDGRITISVKTRTKIDEERWATFRLQTTVKQ